jgi:hypothetical protein
MFSTRESGSVLAFLKPSGDLMESDRIAADDTQDFAHRRIHQVEIWIGVKTYQENQQHQRDQRDQFVSA